MTDEIEREALALWKGGGGYDSDVRHLRGLPFFNAICRAVEQLHAERAAHEATKAEFARFRQEVSDAVKNSRDRELSGGYEEAGWATANLYRFIISPLDPITEWLHKSGYEGNTAVEQAVRAYAEERGNG